MEEALLEAGAKADADAKRVARIAAVFMVKVNKMVVTTVVVLEL